MSADETVEISKDLLRRVMAEVQELREALAEARTESDAPAESADGFSEERDDLVREIDAMRAAVQTATAERDEARADAAEARTRIQATSTAASDRDRLQRELNALRRDHDDLQAEHAALLRTHPLPPTRTARSASVEDNPDGASDTEALARAFVAWCRRGSPLISRSYLFAAFLREASGQACAVQTVFRDRSEPVPTFTDRPSAGAEYWLVTLGNLHAVLPQPSNPRAFAETAGAFGGEAAPDGLTAFTPAIPDDLTTPFGLSTLGTLA